MGHELHVVDAFTGHPFRGNPAGVCVMDGPADPGWMQQVAAELNHSETAFLHPGSAGAWNLRWFTPAQEVELCGHATLAAAFVLWKTGREQPRAAISFETVSGTLVARQDGDWINLDFPAEPALAIPPVPALTGHWGRHPFLPGRTGSTCSWNFLLLPMSATASPTWPSSQLFPPGGSSLPPSPISPISILSPGSLPRLWDPGRSGDRFRALLPRALLGGETAQDRSLRVPVLAAGRDSQGHAQRRPGDPRRARSAYLLGATVGVTGGRPGRPA